MKQKAREKQRETLKSKYKMPLFRGKKNSFSAKRRKMKERKERDKTKQPPKKGGFRAK